jgi:hypothetical protein
VQTDVQRLLGALPKLCKWQRVIQRESV